MPHIRIEVTDNISIAFNKLLAAINRTLICSSEFKEADIKSRVVPLQFYLASNDKSAGFIHIQLELMAGRSDALKASLAQALLETLSSFICDTKLTIQSSVHVSELNPACYAKALFNKQDIPALTS
ncbi:5-carboxymethyl-2-hydroxymuconate Delta-isomerase [Alteromonas sp. CYL-A6]|uniref:5-carboxymethyl-2-hydroxymuconate Delta-isomerase n=1 Tax=Alteromonas nitratireducens TaxID=3390813 RepID=UPI0034B664D3